MVTIHTPLTLNDEQLTRFTGYPVTLPLFEGPLDLLLYLIKRQELDIYDIPIARITAQFFDYMALLDAQDIEIAADFLVMSASLMEIKSRMLLPRPPVFVDENEAEDVDPRAELVRQLLEYQKYKSAAGDLAQRAEERKRLFSRTNVVPNLSICRPDPALTGNPDAFSLWAALQEVLVRAESMAPAVREVLRPKVTIRQQMVHILHLLANTPRGVTFARLFFDDNGHIPTRTEIIVTFLAVLELIRVQRIRVVQRELFGEIRIVLTAISEVN